MTDVVALKRDKTWSQCQMTIEDGHILLRYLDKDGQWTMTDLTLLIGLSAEKAVDNHVKTLHPQAL